MNKRFITGVLILACVSFIVRQSYGCTDSPIARIVNELYQDVPVGTRVYFDGIGSSVEETGSYDPDNGSPYGGGNGIDKYYWKYGDDPNDPNWYDDGGEPSHVYDTAGVYDVALYVVDDDNDRSDSNDYCEVWVYKIDKVVKDGTTNEGSLYVCLNGTVDLEAKPYPNYVEYYPTEETIWDVNQQPEGADALLDPDSNSLTTTLSGMTETGDYVITAKCGPNDPGDDITVTVDVEMKLEKVGNTTIEAGNNYSENTTIRVTAVHPATGETCTCFTGDVNIAEDTSDPNYVEIYSQNGGYLPGSITFTGGDNGVKTFVAKSLAGPPPEEEGSSPADPARIITTNYDVYNETGYLPVPQWTNDLGQVHDKSSGDVYDWFETRTKDIFDGASGDLATVLSKMAYYDQTTGAYGGQIIDWNHTATSGVHFNPHWVQTRLDTDASDYCGDPRSKYHTNSVIHEARHCYQDYLSSVDLGQPDDIAGKPNNDDDEDWLVETVPIAPSNYILDTGTSRSKCSGTDSFSGDATYDTYWSGGTRSALDNVIEKDAATYADNND